MFPRFAHAGPRPRARLHAFGALLCRWLLLLAAAPAAFAQFEISGGSFNPLVTPAAPVPNPNNPPQFAGEMANTGGSAAIAHSPTLTVRFPASSHLVLHRSSIGPTFASGVSRYALGDLIVPPPVPVSILGGTADAYWRAEPVKAGEVFSDAAGTTTPVAANTTRNYYYSRHAERVLASQSGAVVVKWVTSRPVPTATDPTLRYRFQDESFSVSSATSKPIRSMFWTERGFNSPVVSIAPGKIEAVNPVYSANFPATVPAEYIPVGANPPDPSAAPPSERRTLWFEKIGGIGQLRAYNFEGRILVEYLGAQDPNIPGKHLFLGADIVEVARVAPSINASVNLGDQITPRDDLNRLLPLDAATEWIAAPVANTSPDALSFYGTVSRPDGRTIYFAERENANPDRVVFYWLEAADASIHLLTGGAKPGLDLFWPQQRNNYFQRWPDLATPAGRKLYEHYTVATGGSTTATGLQFIGGQLPQIVFQDDPAQAQATIDVSSQRLVVALPTDSTNLTLLKFTSGSHVWYVRLSTQVDGRPGFLESDGAASALTATAHVGDRINPPPNSGDIVYSGAGYIASGTNYLPAAYLDPFVVGAEAAARGAIIPINARAPAVLKVWWFKRVQPPSPAFQPFFVPAKVATYNLSYPSSPAVITLANNAGSGDLPADQAAGSVYFQNDAQLPGYNPNEEHALLLGGRLYALRNDLNVTTADASYTSQPYALLRYTAAADGLPAAKAFRIDLGTFAPVATAGIILQPPMPLPLLPPPLNPDGTLKNIEVTDNAAPNSGVPEHYRKFTFADRKGYHWLYRGPHAGGTPTFNMRFYYAMREGFFVPGVTPQPTVGTLLPYLRDGAGPYTGDVVDGPARAIPYTPSWPASAPELRVAETLTLPKFGLPEILSQSSAFVLYQQSVAATTGSPASVILHDPIREKTFALGTAGALQTLPTSILTTTYQGKTYFQRLPPHLQKRFYFDPLRGAKGTLVFVGQFVDEAAGEDYLHLNALSADELAVLQNLPAAGDVNGTHWRNAIISLRTAVETFGPDRAKAGAFVRDGPPEDVGAQALARIDHSDTAVADYALTATGAGQGYVSLLFGNGRAFTPEAEPVAVKIIKVVPRLYRGELKTLLSSNPLDEQVSLRHTGDFAARPQDYDFQWRYAQPVNGVAPEIYTYTLQAWTSAQWKLVSHPAGALPTTQEYAAVTTITSLPHSRVIYTQAPVGDNPGLVARAESLLSFTGSVPQRIVFSADLADRTGFVLYVNGHAALAYQAPAAFAATSPVPGLVTMPPALTAPLPLQFSVDSNFFSLANNRIEVALFTSADVNAPASQLNFRIDYFAPADQIAALAGSSPWIEPTGTLSNSAIVGGSPTAPLGSPLLVMSDNYFTMRYRPKSTSGSVAPKTDATNYAWSEWMPPKLVEGWIKRVLAAINPFNQRMRDLYNNAVNTDVSLLTQAGTRWEGDIALTLENINDAGLIEIYETVLNRGKSMSIDAGVDYPAANDALLLAAGYLADLYMIAGNEAFADAANPTISLDDSTTVTEVNTSRFSFESQVKSVLDEELSLLRGRDDFLTPGVTVAPAYNRLYWNYTRGINSGEALYAVNYNIREKSGSATADGTIDAADAQRMFPQAHGDAYGHYLTALKGYYRLLRSPKFTWTPRSEAVTVLGQTIQVDYFDERKFASAAAGVARTAQQVVALTHRQLYKDDAAAGWTHYRDGKENTVTNTRRDWGLDECASRAAQGAYINWAVGNALLPDVDNQPSHTGIQVIDRATVPELAELTTFGADFQTRMDNANARLNPLGLSPGAIAFDISAADLKAGKSHYEQIYDRSLRAVLNAKGAFDQAGRMTRLLRNQENQIGNSNDAIVDQERAFTKQLIELYGTPYSGEIGVGKTYAQGYSGPDTQTWFVVDRATDLIETATAFTITGRVPTAVQIPGNLTMDALLTYQADKKITNFTTRTFTIAPNQVVQFSDRFSATPMGARAVTGTLQQALGDVHQAHLALQGRVRQMQDKGAILARRGQLYDEMVTTHADTISAMNNGRDAMAKLRLAQASLQATAKIMDALAEAKGRESQASTEFLPKMTGLANDVFAGVRGAMTVGFNTIGYLLKFVSVSSEISAAGLEREIRIEQRALDEKVRDLAFSYQQAQVAFEYELLLRDFIDEVYDVAQIAGTLQRTTERVRNLVADGDRIQAEREIFRQRAAALIQGYRTRDLTFRTFRNEALEQYRSLFELAGRYSYLAAKSYDYETGLLGSTAGQSVIEGIVASRALGDLTGGVPQATVSTLGDSGLAGTMARLQGDWSVAKGRLGINNPDSNGTLFSLRRELFRVLDDPATTDDDAQWQQTLEQHIVSNLLADPDVAALCRNLRNADGSAVPGIVIPFSTAIRDHQNFFGLPLVAGDHAFTPTNFATKLYAVGTVFRGYIGMDPYSQNVPNAGTPNGNDPKALSASPHVYLIPAGTDYMLAPPLGDTGVVRAFTVRDQALPLPFNLGATQFSTTQFFNANGTLTEQPWVLRKHQSFRAVNDPVFFYSTVPAEFTNTRLVGRSVWNSQWKLVIPAKTLLANEQEGLSRFVASVKDIELFLRTYSHSGN